MKIVNALSLLLACSLVCTGAVYGQEATEYTVIETETQNEADSTDSAQSTGSMEYTSTEEQAYIEETLNLANNEEVTWSYMEDADAWVMSIVSAVAYPELPDQQAMDELGQLYTKLVRLQDLLKNPDSCRVRLVCIPERMVVEETRRSYMYLNLYHYPVDGVFINRILPEHTGSSFMENWQKIQSGYLEELESVFTQIPVTRIPWFSEEIRGMEAVERLCRTAFADKDLFDRPVRTDNEIYAPIEGGYSLTILVPGADRKDVEVFKRDMDVDIRIRNYLRSIPLPGVLRGAQMTSAVVEDGKLTICFAVKDRETVG